MVRTPFLYTAGYERRGLEEFLGILRAAGVAVLADVRENPFSRRADFSKRRLQIAAESAGFRYVHLPALGAAKAIRDRWKVEHDWQAFSKGYRTHLCTQEEALATIEQILRSSPTCLMCLERAPESCHRSLLADLLIDRHAGSLDVRHL